MIKKDLVKFFIDETYCNPPRKNIPSNKIVNNHLDEIWSIDLADMIDYKLSNNNGLRYILVIIVDFSNSTWCIHLKKRCGETITKMFSKMLTK